MNDEFFNIGRPKDNLTQVYSREVITDYVNHLIEEGTPFTFALVDIDNFKYVNDTFGHIAGDKILKTVANRLIKLIGSIGTVARFGGDEFILVFPRLIDYDAVWTTCRSIMMFMNNFEISDFEGLFVTLTIGLARFPENAKTYDDVFETADKALYRGKMKGRNCFVIYLPEKHAHIDLKNSNAKTISSMQLHSHVFAMLTTGPSLGEGVFALFNYFSSYLMIDHLCIQSLPDNPDGGNKIYFEKTHELSRNQSFLPINLLQLADATDKAMGLFYTNNVGHLEEAGKIDLLGEYRAQQIQSACAVEVSICGTLYGILRAESTSVRIWQRGDLDILVTTARTLAILLHERNLTLKDL